MLMMLTRLAPCRWTRAARAKGPSAGGEEGAEPVWERARGGPHGRLPVLPQDRPQAAQVPARHGLEPLPLHLMLNSTHKLLKLAASACAHEPLSTLFPGFLQQGHSQLHVLPDAYPDAYSSCHSLGCLCKPVRLYPPIHAFI